MLVSGELLHTRRMCLEAAGAARSDACGQVPHARSVTSSLRTTLQVHLRTHTRAGAGAAHEMNKAQGGRRDWRGKLRAARAEKWQ
eukprot:38203-Rhodomonas_salina.1